jgi:hypothetical protein
MLAERPGTMRRLLVDLACLLCGDGDQLLAESARRLPTLPRPCTRCGGFVVATAAQWVVMPDPKHAFEGPVGRQNLGRAQAAHSYTWCSPFKTGREWIGPVTGRGLSSGVCNPSVRCGRSWL